jgi:hypothetical protein
MLTLQNNNNNRKEISYKYRPIYETSYISYRLDDAAPEGKRTQLWPWRLTKPRNGSSQAHGRKRAILLHAYDYMKMSLNRFT